jgi:hypothetical protein
MIGVYSGGSIYNPSQVLRDETVLGPTEKMDKMLASIPDKEFAELPVADLKALIALTMPDQAQAEFVWDPLAVAESIAQFAKLNDQVTGYVYVDRDRDLKKSRHETQGILTGGEAARVPTDKIALFLLRTKPGRGKHAAWWPQIKFPAGRYAFAFAV